MCASDVMLRHQTKHERHGVGVQSLTCKALERQKQKKFKVILLPKCYLHLNWKKKEHQNLIVLFRNREVKGIQKSKWDRHLLGKQWRQPK